MKKAILYFSVLLILLLLSVSALAEQPCPGTQKCGREGCYWCTPMDIDDTEAVWKMLCSPLTVLDGNQKDQYLVRAEPSKTSRAIADCTYASQGVHVLETLSNGWTKIELRSSSFSDSSVKAYNQLVTGYVESKYLKEVTPNNEKYALVIDKMTQRIYIFVDGKLFSTLLCSTGIPSKGKLYNETMSGDFIICSPVGDFNSDNLVCEMGLRFNRGDILHQVPYIVRDDYIDFDTCEKALGTRASHGCIRVQRKPNAEGVNMTWLWNNRRMTSRLVIWEDSPGRSLALPANDSTVYVNSAGGKTYHKYDTCTAVASRYLPLVPINYYDLLQDPYRNLTPCATCVPLLRPETYRTLTENTSPEQIIYLETIDGAYYHQDPCCSLLDPEFWPLLPARITCLQEPAFADLQPCPLCIIKAQNPTLYYNPTGGKYYHSTENCASVASRYLPLSPFEYRQLNESAFSSLRPCTKCNPPKRGVYPID